MAIFSTPAPESADGPKPPFNRRKGDGIPLSIVARDMTITGDMETKGVVKVEGRIKGTIRAEAQVIISPGAMIEGDLYTKEAVVAGEIQGTINATERVELQATALVRGDIATPRIAILEGGKVTGEVNMTEPAPGEPKKSLEVSSGS